VVTPPPHRFDIEIEEDLIEEVARVYGFRSHPSDAAGGAGQMLGTTEARPLAPTRVGDAPREARLSPGDHYSFVDAEWTRPRWQCDRVRVLNPIASQMS